MTAGERNQIDILMKFLDEWREDDREWKRDTDKRLRGVEAYVNSDAALNAAVTAAGHSRTAGFRARVALALSAVGVCISAALGAASLLR